MPAAIGNILGTLWGGPVVDWWIVRRAKRNGGVYEPEMRIELFALPAVGMVVGVLMYGLTIAKVSLLCCVLACLAVEAAMCQYCR